MSNAASGELAIRVGAMVGRIGVPRPADLARDLDTIRRLAAASGHFPVLAVTQALEAAVARGERGALVRDWLHVLGEALGSARQDAAAGDAYAAACSVRFVG